MKTTAILALFAMFATPLMAGEAVYNGGKLLVGVTALPETPCYIEGDSLTVCDARLGGGGSAPRDNGKADEPEPAADES